MMAFTELELAALHSALGNHPSNMGGHASQYTPAQHQPQEAWWAQITPRTAIDDYTLVLAFATIGLLLVTWRLARTGAQTVKSFVEVERANIVMTLDNFGEKQTGEKNEGGGITVTDTWLKFDVVANNLGRSSALITHVAHAWQESSELEEASLFVGPPKTYIVKAGDSTVISLGSMQNMKELAKRRFLWLLVSYRAPLLDDEDVIRVCFEVFGVQSNIHYKEAKREYWKKALSEGSAKPWWQRVLGRRG